jgi:hypothetical protein
VEKGDFALHGLAGEGIRATAKRWAHVGGASQHSGRRGGSHSAAAMRARGHCRVWASHGVALGTKALYCVGRGPLRTVGQDYFAWAGLFEYLQ